MHSSAEATQSPADVQFRVGDFVFTNARYGKKGKKGNELGVDYHVGRVMEVMGEEAHLEFWAIAQDPDGADVPYTYARCPEPYGPREPLGALFPATVLEPPYTWGGELVVELDTREMEQKMQKEMDELEDRGAGHGVRAVEERQEERQRRSARKRRADENKENEAPLAIAAPQDTARPAKKSRQKPGSPNNLQKTLAILKRPRFERGHNSSNKKQKRR